VNLLLQEPNSIEDAENEAKKQRGVVLFVIGRNDPADQLVSGRTFSIRSAARLKSISAKHLSMVTQKQHSTLLSDLDKIKK
jgi:hypothetical protein